MQENTQSAAHPLYIEIFEKQSSVFCYYNRWNLEKIIRRDAHNIVPREKKQEEEKRVHVHGLTHPH